MVILGHRTGSLRPCICWERWCRKTGWITIKWSWRCFYKILWKFSHLFLDFCRFYLTHTIFFFNCFKFSLNFSKYEGYFKSFTLLDLLHRWQHYGAKTVCTCTWRYSERICKISYKLVKNYRMTRKIMIAATPTTVPKNELWSTI